MSTDHSHGKAPEFRVKSRLEILEHLNQKLLKILNDNLNAQTPPSTQLKVALRYNEGGRNQRWFKYRSAETEAAFLGRGINIIKDAARDDKKALARKAFSSEEIAAAQFAMGGILESGRQDGVQQVLPALHMYMKSTSRGHEAAEKRLEELLKLDLGALSPSFKKKVTKLLENLPHLSPEPDFTHTTLVDFLEKNLNNPKHELDVALRYFHGAWAEHRNADTERVFSIRGHWVIEKAAREGHADAQDAMGEMHWTGTRMNQNLDEGVKWYALAAAQGQPNSIKRLKEEALKFNLGLPKRPEERQNIEATVARHKNPAPKPR